MPKTVSKSGLAARLGDKGRKAFDTHKTDSTDFGSGSLPAGIEGGIAQLVECDFRVYDNGDLKGKDYFYCKAVVITPESFKGVRTAGKPFFMREPLCDTPTRSRKDIDAHLAHVLNEMRKLGCTTGEIQLDDLETTAAALAKASPYFNFRTWKGEATKEFPNPLVNVVWEGACEYAPQEGAGNVVQDNTVDTTSPSNEPDAETGDAGEDDGIDALVEVADGEAGEAATQAQTELANKAKEAGVTEDAVGNAQNWAEVGEMIRAGGGSADTSTEPTTESQELVPEKGNVLKYKPPKAKKKVEIEVTAVFETAKKVNGKNLEDGKTIYKGIPWDELSEE